MDQVYQDISGHKDTINPIHTDFYQITMAYAYYHQNKHNDPAAFEAFYRIPPFKGNYVVFGGLKEAILFLRDYKITKDDILYLRSQLPKNANEGFFDWLVKLDCSQIKLYGFKEGSIVFPREPIVRIEGPLGLVQLLETTLLNLLSFPSLIATNASRFRQLAGNKVTLLEFGLRRAQGPDGGLSASCYAYLGGFDQTSNALCGLRYGIPIKGTMAHSFVTSFDSLDQVQENQCIMNGVNIKTQALKYRNELKFNHTNDGELAAFIAYSLSFPENFTCLVDTYDTLNSGVLNFLLVAMTLQDAKHTPLGIRLDSGNLAKLSIDAKKIFKTYGDKFNRDFSQLKVVASDSIDENVLIQLKKDGHQIDIFGIGTHLATCKKEPALGLVYKLVELNGKGRLKNSNDFAKSTLPSKKNVYRVYVQSQKTARLDVITCIDEKIDVNQPFQVRSILNTMKKFNIVATSVQNLLELFWDGKVVNKIDNIHEAKQYFNSQIQIFDQEVLALENFKQYDVMISEKFYQEFYQALEKINVTIDIQ